MAFIGKTYRFIVVATREEVTVSVARAVAATAGPARRRRSRGAAPPAAAAGRDTRRVGVCYF